ncbi:MAG: hypothetical protein A3G73_08280 [Rhodospirillales bacterium RIFCSPLOWO2_12_FULL_67_15]|nr:MAG: hypothetical protein A3G73_08280 [Rhodospirillales bacterium RIFCSPLOWO2_12_FULL_67_15]
MKTLSRILGGVVVLIVAVLVAVVAVLKSMDFNPYRGLIADHVKAATGRELVIAGPLDLEISLTPSLAVESVTFANAPWGARKDMIVLKRLAAEVQLMPLLKGEVRVNRLVLSGLDVLLEVDGRGQTNWDLAPPGGVAARPGAPQGPLPLVNKVDVRDLRLAYRDARDGTTLDLAVESFTLEGKDAESPLAVTLKASHNGRPVAASGQFGSLKTLAEANARFPVRLAIATSGLKASIEGHVVEPRAPKEFDFKASVNGDNIAAVAALLQPALTAVRAPAAGPLEAAFRIKGKGRVYAIEEIAASAGQSDLAGSARVSLAGRVPEISAALRSRRLDLKELFPAAKEPPAAPGLLSGRPAPPGDGRVFPAGPLPLDALRIANADIGYKIEAVVLPGGVTVRDVDAKGALKDGRLALPVELTAAGGRVNGEATLDGSRIPAALALRLDGANVDWGRLLADTGMTEMVWDSKAEAAIDLKGSGRSVREIMASLEGEAKVVLGPGRIGDKYLDLAGADVFTQIVTALNPFAKSDEFTALGCAVARFKVAGGVAETHDGIALETGKMIVTGGGRIDFRTEALDLAFKPEARQGFGLGLGNVVGLVRIEGTLGNPSYGLDPLAVVTGTVGAVTGAVGTVTGGLSAIARSLFEDRGTTEVSPCQVALGRPRPRSQPPQTETRSPPPPPGRKDEGLGGAVRGLGEELGRGLKGLLGR